MGEGGYQDHGAGNPRQLTIAVQLDQPCRKVYTPIGVGTCVLCVHVRVPWILQSPGLYVYLQNVYCVRMGIIGYVLLAWAPLNCTCVCSEY